MRAIELAPSERRVQSLRTMAVSYAFQCDLPKVQSFEQIAAESQVDAQKITDVAFVQLTAFDGRSQRINSDAAPILLQETLSAQSATIDSVSGATYTSDGYVESLQSALDQAGLK